MVTFTEVIESLQTEQEKTTKAVESLDNRMLEFISLSKRSMLDDLEDRREARRQARRGGFFGLGGGRTGQRGGNQQNPFGVGQLIQGLLGARFAVMALGALSTALLSPVGLGILASIATATVASLGLTAYLTRLKSEQVAEVLEERPSTPQERELLQDFYANPSVETAKAILKSPEVFQDVGGLGEEMVGKGGEPFLRFSELFMADMATRGISPEESYRLRNLMQEAVREVGSTRPDPSNVHLAPVAVVDEQGRIDPIASAAQYLSVDPANAMTVEEAQRSFNLQNIDGSPVAPLTPAEIETERADVAKQIEASEERQMGLIRRLIGVIGFGKAETRDEIRQRLSTEGYLSDLVPQPPTPTEVQTSSRNVDGLLKAAANYIDRIVRFAAMTSDIIPPDPNDPNYGRLMQDFMLLDEASRRGVPIGPLVSPKGQMLEQMGGELGVGGVTIINQTTNNVSSGGGGGGGTAPNTQSSTAAPTNTHNYGISPVDVISAGASR